VAFSESYRRILYKFGYYSYQEGLIYRYIKQKGGWDDHLAKCRSFILKAVERIKPEKVTVLGSGWLLDFPLAELMEKGLNITLIDLVHPPDVKKQLEGNRMVRLLEDDLTGGLIEEIWKKAGTLPFYRKLQSPESINIPEYFPEGDPGLMVSLNLLSQLDVLPLKILKRKSSFSEEDILRLRSEIQAKHINMLKNYSSVLITDVEEIYLERDGIEYGEKTVVVQLPDAEYREEWVWDFDLTHTDYYRKNSVLKVVAMILKRSC